MIAVRSWLTLVADVDATIAWRSGQSTIGKKADYHGGNDDSEPKTHAEFIRLSLALEEFFVLEAFFENFVADKNDNPGYNETGKTFHGRIVIRPIQVPQDAPTLRKTLDAP